MEALAREIAATAEEYRRGLMQAFPGGVSGGPLRYEVVQGDAAMEIELAPGAARTLGGLLCLPSLAVRIRFTGGTPQAQAALLAQLDRASHRGGG